MNPLPPLFLFTDPERTPAPDRAAERLPIGAGVVFRAFGALDAIETGLKLAEVARARSLTLLVGQDAALAEAIGAQGVHLPERRLGEAVAIRRARPDWFVTAAAHSRLALRSANLSGFDAIFVSPVFASDSASAGSPIGASRLAGWIDQERTPVYALGGVTAASVHRLRNTGAAGLAAVAGLLG